MVMSKERKLKYGIKAYGRWFCFSTKGEYENYLMEWMSKTEGSERDRAVDALLKLRKGVNFTDTDV